MKVERDYVCDHGFPSPWATCLDCMSLPSDERPEPPLPDPPRRAPRKGQLPRTEGDRSPPLIGNKDMSFPVHDFDAHTLGDGNDWLLAVNGFPWDLRPGGWVYLRNEGRLGARVRVKGIGFRTERRYHTGSGDAGPGPTIEVDPATWQRVEVDLGELAESQRQGYRYLITTVDGDVVHLSTGKPVPSEIDVDPPAGITA